MKAYPNVPTEPVLQPAQAADRPLEFLSDVKLNCSVVLGTCSLSIRQLLTLAPGSVMELKSEEGEPLEFRVNGNPVAKGEMVAVNDRYGIRITEVLDPADLGAK